ncbi:MAG TPA: hypothetical protein VFX96_12200 [Pyrinomonadaceae bacterium]|nr:hypothetical protein [Pyrinomonadaceae bacterium]
MSDETPHTVGEGGGGKLAESRSLLERLTGAVYVNRDVDASLSMDEYVMHIELYRHYLDVTLKAIVFFYAIAGTLLTLVFSRDKFEGVVAQGGSPELQASMMKLFVVTPLIISGLLAGSFILGSFLWGRLTHVLNRKLERSRLLAVPPFTHVLTVVLFCFGVIFLFVTYLLNGIVVQSGITWR